MIVLGDQAIGGGALQNDSLPALRSLHIPAVHTFPPRSGFACHHYGNGALAPPHSRANTRKLGNLVAEPYLHQTRINTNLSEKEKHRSLTNLVRVNRGCAKNT